MIFMSLSAWLIRQNLKTVTRRVIKPQPSFDGTDWWWNHRNGAASKNTLETLRAARPVELTARYGDVGDYLWVKEPYFWNKAAPFPSKGHAPNPTYLHNMALPSTLWHEYYKDYAEGGRYELHSPMFMPRWACHLDGLRIEDLSVSRVQEMDRAEAEREGVLETTGEFPPHLFPAGVEPHEWDNRTSVENFRFIWNRLHGQWGAVYAKVDGKRQVVRFECFPWAETDIPPVPRPAERNTLPCIAYPNPWVCRIEFSREGAAHG